MQRILARWFRFDSSYFANSCAFDIPDTDSPNRLYADIIDIPDRPFAAFQIAAKLTSFPACESCVFLVTTFAHLSSAPIASIPTAPHAAPPW